MGRTRALELDVAPEAVLIDDFAQEDGASVSELRDKSTELVSSIRRGDGRGSVGGAVAGQDLHPFLADEPLRIKAEV